jgi:hypothetical protein
VPGRRKAGEGLIRRMTWQEMLESKRLSNISRLITERFARVGLCGVFGLRWSFKVLTRTIWMKSPSIHIGYQDMALHRETPLGK